MASTRVSMPAMTISRSHGDSARTNAFLSASAKGVAALWLVRTKSQSETLSQKKKEILTLNSGRHDGMEASGKRFRPPNHERGLETEYSQMFSLNDVNNPASFPRRYSTLLADTADTVAPAPAHNVHTCRAFP